MAEIDSPKIAREKNSITASLICAMYTIGSMLLLLIRILHVKICCGFVQQRPKSGYPSLPPKKCRNRGITAASFEQVSPKFDKYKFFQGATEIALNLVHSFLNYTFHKMFVWHKVKRFTFFKQMKFKIA